MTADWIPFHRRLVRGSKRALPRAVRFVYLELALEARLTGGVIDLPIEWSTLDAVCDLLGGDREDIKGALEAFTKPDEGGISPIEIVVTKALHRVILTRWEQWAGARSNAERVRAWRAREKEKKIAKLERSVTESNAGNVTRNVTRTHKQTNRSEEQKRPDRSDPRSKNTVCAVVTENEKANGASAPHTQQGPKLDAETQVVASRIRHWPIFADLPAERIAYEFSPRMTQGVKLAWALDAIDDAAKQCADGTTYQEKHRHLVKYLGNARRPRETNGADDTHRSAAYAPPLPDDPSEMEATRKHHQERLAKAALVIAEREAAKSKGDK